MKPVTLTTRRLILRPFEPSDASAVLDACQDPDIQRWTGVPSPYRREHADDFVQRICPEGWHDDITYNFALVTKGDQALAGSMGLVRLEHLRGPEHQAELGYWTAKEHRRRGFAVEAGRAVVEWAFAGLGVERLEWCAEAGNDASRAVALALGFHMEGTDRARIVHGGTRRDAWRGSVLPSDWRLPSATPYLPAPAGASADGR
ncbi:GNAT family N-acetyltransferase [Streptomyces sp. M19]